MWSDDILIPYLYITKTSKRPTEKVISGFDRKWENTGTEVAYIL